MRETIGADIKDPTGVFAFWRAAGSGKWFETDDAFDAEIRARFLGSYEAAASGHLNSWETTPEGALALVLLLDQFPRNMFRDTPRAFAADPLARAVADRALAHGFDKRVPKAEQLFFYLPFEHSEDPADQERCVALCRNSGDADALKWAELHADVIRRFGRFPHRNSILGRASTPEEETFLASGGFAG